MQPTGTKDSSVIGLDGLARVCEAVGPDFPVVAIGGLSAGRVSDAIARGAAGAAVVTAVFGQPDVAAAAAELREEAEAALTARLQGFAARRAEAAQDAEEEARNQARYRRQQDLVRSSMQRQARR